MTLPPSDGPGNGPRPCIGSARARRGGDARTRRASPRSDDDRGAPAPDHPLRDYRIHRAEEDERDEHGSQTTPGVGRTPARQLGRRGGRVRRVRDHRRPREGDDVPLALPARAARAARLPDRRRRGRRLERSTTCASAPARRSSAAARRSTTTVFDRLRRAALLRRRATSATPPPTSALAAAIEGAEQPGLLPRDPAVPVRHGGQGAGRGRADRDRPRRGREAVRPRPRVGARARRRAAPVHRRVAALPDRPLPREDGPRRDPLPALRQHDARAGLEPQLRRVACRSRWPRTSASRTAATSTTRSARCATSSSTT